MHCRAPYCIMLSSGFALHHPALPDLELHSSASCCPACLLALLAWGCPGLPAADLPYAIPPGLCAPPEPAAAWCWGDKSCLGGGGTGRWGDAQVRQRWVWGVYRGGHEQAWLSPGWEAQTGGRKYPWDERKVHEIKGMGSWGWLS